MQYLYTEEQVSELIYKIKGFKCAKCGSEKSIKGKKPYDRRCGECKTNYPLTVNTAFEGQRIPLDKAIEMLVDTQRTYITFLKTNEYKLKIGDFDQDDLDNPLTKEWIKSHKDEKKNFEFVGTPARKSSEDLAVQFGLEKKSVQAFFKKLADWLPKEFGNMCYADEEWFKHLKTEESKKDWTKIFNLLFDPFDGWHFGETHINRKIEKVLFISIRRSEPDEGQFYYMGEEYYNDLKDRQRDEEIREQDAENERLQKEWAEEFEKKHGYKYIP